MARELEVGQDHAPSAAAPMVFEFRGLPIMAFRVELDKGILVVSTLKQVGGAAQKSWIVGLDDVREVRISERVSWRFSSSALFLRPRAGNLVMFSWREGSDRASAAPIYYAAAAVVLRALAKEHPTMIAAIGPLMRVPFIIGSLLSAALPVLAAWFTFAPGSIAFYAASGIGLAWCLFCFVTSGVFRPIRKVTLTEAADELETRGAAFRAEPS